MEPNLTQADFILTLLSVFREQDRRRLEEFARDSRIVPGDGAPSAYNHLVQPDPDQLLRVAVLVAFRRGRLQAVLALLRGASVETDESLPTADREAQLDKLTAAIDEALDLTSWHEYIKSVLAAGFRRASEISSRNTVVLVYALYLIGRSYGISHSDLRTPIARYFFMASLTSRYTGSFETQITQDVQAFTQAEDGAGYLARLRSATEAVITSDFWTINLPQSLATSSSRSPTLFAYAASLCLLNARVPPFSGEGIDGPKAAILIRDLFDPIVHAKKAPIERHHLFPRKYLEDNGVRAPARSTRSRTSPTWSGRRTSRSRTRHRRTTGRGFGINSLPMISFTTGWPPIGATTTTALPGGPPRSDRPGHSCRLREHRRRSHPGRAGRTRQADVGG